MEHSAQHTYALFICTLPLSSHSSLASCITVHAPNKTCSSALQHGTLLVSVMICSCYTWATAPPGHAHLAQVGSCKLALMNWAKYFLTLLLRLAAPPQVKTTKKSIVQNMFEIRKVCSLYCWITVNISYLILISHHHQCWIEGYKAYPSRFSVKFNTFSFWGW